MFTIMMLISDHELSSHYIKEASLEGHKKAQIYLSKNQKDSDVTDYEIKAYQNQENENTVFKETKQRKDFYPEYQTVDSVNNSYLCMCKCIFSGEFEHPLKYGISLYRQKRYAESMYYMNALSKFGHPIAKYFIGVMKYKGKGCDKNEDESYSIMKELSSGGIDQATKFLDDNF